MSNMLLNKREIAVLEEFASDYGRKVYGREIAGKLGMNQKTVSNILNKLESQDILKFLREGRNKYYHLNRFNPNIKEAAKLIEIERKINFLEKYKKLRELFGKIEERAKGVTVVFGSYAKGISTAKSDLDIFVIGKIPSLDDLEGLYNIKINTIQTDKNRFNYKEPLIKEIISSHIVLKGVEGFIELLWQI